MKSDEVVPEISSFLSEVNLKNQAKESDVFNWWNLNKSKYPHLASFAERKYVSAPPSSIF